MPVFRTYLDSVETCENHVIKLLKIWRDGNVKIMFLVDRVFIPKIDVKYDVEEFIFTGRPRSYQILFLSLSLPLSLFNNVALN